MKDERAARIALPPENQTALLTHTGEKHLSQAIAEILNRYAEIMSAYEAGQNVNEVIAQTNNLKPLTGYVYHKPDRKSHPNTKVGQPEQKLIVAIYLHEKSIGATRGAVATIREFLAETLNIETGSDNIFRIVRRFNHGANFTPDVIGAILDKYNYLDWAEERR